MKSQLNSFEPTGSNLSQGEDPWIYRIIVGALSLTVISCVAGSIILHIHEKTSPDLLTALGTGSLGALAGLLVPAPAKR